MIEVVELSGMCAGYPTEWVAVSNDNRVLYIRYRHGTLKVSVGPTFSDAVAASAEPLMRAVAAMLDEEYEPKPCKGEIIYHELIADDDGGDISFEDMRDHVSGLITFRDQMIAVSRDRMHDIDDSQFDPDVLDFIYADSRALDRFENEGGAVFTRVG